MAAARRLAAINSDIQIEPVVADLTPGNAEELLGESDLILDGTDNFETRYLINDYAVSHGVALDLRRGGGQLRNFDGGGAREDGLFAVRVPGCAAGAQPTCETAGVLGSVTALIASLQVSEAIKILCGADHRGRSPPWMCGRARSGRSPSRVPTRNVPRAVCANSRT